MLKPGEGGEGCFGLKEAAARPRRALRWKSGVGRQRE